MKKVGHKLTACMWEGWSLVGAVAGWSCLVPGCCCFSLLLPCLLPHVGVSLSGSCLRCLLCLSGLLLLSGALVCNWANSGTRGRVGKLRKKRKRHVSYRLLKKEITNWTIRSSKTARVCFSCRFVGARRFKRNFRERKRLKPFCWWMPHCGAGEVAASKRKKQEQGQQDLATALTSFLHSWNETASTKRQRYSQTQEQMRQSAN